jgi:segregation and condensation protein A
VSGVIVAGGEPVPVMITFAAARRAEDATRVRLDVFDGPLAVLLSLIEQRQLDVLTVRLGDLAPAFLDALAKLETGRLPLLSAFVSVSAQLILIKSRAALPRPPVADELRIAAGEEADPEEELRRRLLLYKQFRDAGARLAAIADAGRSLFHREAETALAAGQRDARPPQLPALDARLLVDALRTSVRLAVPLEPRPAVLPRTVTLEQRADLIRRALRDAPKIVLQELLHDVQDRVVVAVTFMALLEMVKGREIAIEQREPWGPISVSAINDR